MVAPITAVNPRRPRAVSLALLAAIVAGLAGPSTLPGGSVRSQSPLPPWFDGCEYVLPADVEAAFGVPVSRVGPEQGFLGAVTPQAAACRYAPTGVGLDVTLTAWTQASVEVFKGDFEDDGAFEIAAVAETPVVRPEPVTGVGQRAVFGVDEFDQELLLFARQGDLRLRLQAFKNSASSAGVTEAGVRDAFTTLARQVIERVAANPPPQPRLLSPEEMVPPEPVLRIGNGRIVNGGSPLSQSQIRYVGTEQLEVGDNVPQLNLLPGSDAPGELDLRQVAMDRTDDGTVLAAMRLFSPVVLYEELQGQAVRHHYAMRLRPPTGPDMALVLRGDGSTAIVRDLDGAATVTGDVDVEVLGSTIVFTIPPELGVTPDWTIQGEVRLDADRPFPGHDVKGWVTRTVPVTVGALSGEPAAEIPMGGTLYAIESVRSSTFSAVDDPVLRPRMARIEAANGGIDLVLEFDSPPTVVPFSDPGISAGFELVPPTLGAKAIPIRLEWVGSDVAGVRLAAAPEAGTVPVTAEGSTVRFHISDFLSRGPVGDEPEEDSGALVGIDDRAFHLTLPFEDSTSILPTFYDGLTVQLAGPYIALTRDSLGSVALGVIDPVTGDFVASNDAEHWAGTLVGLRAFYSFLGERDRATAAVVGGPPCNFEKYDVKLETKAVLAYYFSPELVYYWLDDIDEEVERKRRQLEEFERLTRQYAESNRRFQDRLLLESAKRMWEECRRRQGTSQGVDPRSSASIPIALAAATRGTVGTAARLAVTLGPAIDESPSPQQVVPVEVDRIPLAADWLVCPYVTILTAGVPSAQSGAPCVAAGLLADLPEGGAGPGTGGVEQPGGSAAPSAGAAPIAGGQGGDGGAWLPVGLVVALVAGLAIGGLLLVRRTRRR